LLKWNAEVKELAVAHFEDLTPYRFLGNRPAAVNIGWLSLRQPYDKGPVAADLVETLRELAVLNPTNQTRGFHTCEFCEDQKVIPQTTAVWKGQVRKLGSAEIWVTSSAGVTYASPDLILHYIESHEYLPPKEYLQAISQFSSTKNAQAPTLSEQVLAVADMPNMPNRSAFYSAFLRSRVGSPVPSEIGCLPPGDRVVTSSDHFTIPLGSGPDGNPAVIVTADVPMLAKQEKGKSFIEMDAKEVIKLAVRQQAGVIVQAFFNGRKAWVSIPKADVIRLSQMD
jgi:hypothetical protein